MPRSLLPRDFGGTGRLQLWHLDSGTLTADLSCRWERDDHVLVEPAVNMSFGAYEGLIVGTRPDWAHVTPSV